MCDSSLQRLWRFKRPPKTCTFFFEPDNSTQITVHSVSCFCVRGLHTSGSTHTPRNYFVPPIRPIERITILLPSQPNTWLNVYIWMHRRSYLVSQPKLHGYLPLQKLKVHKRSLQRMYMVGYIESEYLPYTSMGMDNWRRMHLSSGFTAVCRRNDTHLKIGKRKQFKHTRSPRSFFSHSLTESHESGCVRERVSRSFRSYPTR
jgi:hypothetical protein